MAEACPKCGYREVQGEECPRCRVIVSKYRAYLQRLGQKPEALVQPTGPGAPPRAPADATWPEGSPAGFWIRAAAVMVDSLVLQAVFLPFQLFIVYPTLLAGGIRRPPASARMMAVNAGYYLVTFFVYGGYSVWMHGRWGRTLGKVATGVKVVKVSGEPIGYGRAFGRWLGTLLDFLTLSIGYLLAGIRSDKRALHDLVAGTRVIKIERPWLRGKASGFWMRYAALAIDWQVLGLPVALVGVLAALAIPAMGARRASTPAVAAVVLTLFLFVVLAVVAYSIWMHGKWGQTLGKMALGMKVIKMDGSPLGYGGAFLRWFGSVLSALVFMIGYIMAGVRSDKRALHDLIAGSRVTYIR